MKYELLQNKFALSYMLVFLHSEIWAGLKQDCQRTRQRFAKSIEQWNDLCISLRILMETFCNLSEVLRSSLVPNSQNLSSIRVAIVSAHCIYVEDICSSAFPKILLMFPAADCFFSLSLEIMAHLLRDQMHLFMLDITIQFASHFAVDISDVEWSWYLVTEECGMELWACIASLIISLTNSMVRMSFSTNTNGEAAQCDHGCYSYRVLTGSSNVLDIVDTRRWIGRYFSFLNIFIDIEKWSLQCSLKYWFCDLAGLGPVLSPGKVCHELSIPLYPLFCLDIQCMGLYFFMDRS